MNTNANEHEARTYRITHVTRYVYNEGVNICYNEARQFPRELSTPLCVQRCSEAKIAIEPFCQDRRERNDFFGNRVLYFTIRQPHTEMTVTATSIVHRVPTELAQQAMDYPESPPWEETRESLRSNGSADVINARQFVMDSPMVPLLDELGRYAEPSFQKGRSLLEAAYELMARVYHDFEYDPEATTTATPLKDVLKLRKGVCQDFSHLAIGCLRSQGLAARYVSGYLETLPPPGQERLEGADASHAWFAVYVPKLGWIDFDPTNNILPGNQHITVAWGRDFSDVTPLKGVFFGGGKHELSVSVDVERIDVE